MDAWAEMHPHRPSPKTLREMLLSSVQDSLVALLRYDDRNSMAHSVESRVPFLTPRMANLCLSFPDEFFISRHGVTKYVFREAMRGIVPDAILDRADKIGFAPDNHAWREALRDVAGHVGGSALGGLVSGPALSNAIERCEAGAAVDFPLLWRTSNLIAVERELLAALG
jgi:asparagine synthase (glutamine-hydrolysing)